MPRPRAPTIALGAIDKALPGRVAARRPAPVCFEALRATGAAVVRSVRVAPALLLLALSACATDGRAPHPDLTRIWNEYRALPEQRAMALAGDPRRDRWVTGISAGHESSEEAEADALAECGRRRAQRRMRAACRLYAVGDEIVWGIPE